MSLSLGTNKPSKILPNIQINNLSLIQIVSFSLFKNASTGNIFFTDSDSYYIKFIVYGTSTVYTVVGNGVQGSTGDNGPASNAELYFPDGLALDETNGIIYVADTYNKRVRLGMLPNLT